MLLRSILPASLVSLLLAVLSIGAPAAQAEAEPFDDCYYETVDGEEFVCFRTFLVEENALMVDWLEVATGPMIVVGQVDLSPLGLGPFPAVGVGIDKDSSSCQLYAAFDCEETGLQYRPGVFVTDVWVADACYDRLGIQYAPQGNPDPGDDAWTTIGYYYESSIC